MEPVAPSARGWLRLLGGAASIVLAVLLAVGIVGLVTMSASIRPWLGVLVGINAGYGGVAPASLRVVNPVDIAALVLTSVAFAGFWPGPGRPHKVWMALAIGLPLAGIGVLLATGLAGRSALMAAGIVLSCLMLADHTVRSLGYVGIAANFLVLVADFATVGRSIPVAGLVGIGYLLLLAWFAWIAVTLLAPRSASGSAGPT